MSGLTTTLVIGLMFILLTIGVPVGFALALAGTLGLYLVGGTGLMFSLLETAPLGTVQTFDLLPIPMFLFMAELVLLSRAADAVFKAAAAWMGSIRGGLGIATAVVGSVFGAMCGSSTATAATLSSTTLPAMILQGYQPQMAAGVVAISGTLAMLIPPAIILIIFGLIAEVSVSKLLAAGIFPALLIILTISLTVLYLVWRDPSVAPSAESVPWKTRFALLKPVWPMIVLIIGVLVPIYSGIATVTETSALGAVGGLLVVAQKRKLTWSGVMHAARRAIDNTCMILMVLIGASLFGYFITLTGLTDAAVAAVASLDVSRWVIIALIMLGYAVLGMFMDQVAIIVLTVPVVMPVIISLGFDPIWFGIVLIVTAELGMITPPVGLNCYVVARYSGRSIEHVFGGVTPHIIAHVIAIIILTAFPSITLFWVN